MHCPFLDSVKNMLFVIICLALLLFGSLASINTTRLPLDEVNALRQIGRRLGKTDWDFEEDPCSGQSGWVTTPSKTVPTGYDNNVSCNCEPNTTICHVVSISLKAQSLQGTLPSQFVNLRYLQNIDLTRNFLSGSIPPEWGSMGQLLNISVLANRLTGSIPKEVGNITTLKTLTVEDNLLSGRIPEELGNLSSIERLFLSSNYFTGELPGSFQNLITLKDFRISGNNFSGKIPNFIGGWTSLKSLRIQGSGLEGPIPPNITLLANLSDLRISDLRGPDTVCPPFSNTTYFKNLILRSCNLIGGLPESLASRDLKVLDFSFNKLNGSIPEWYSDLQETDFIYLTGNLLSGDVPDWMLTLGDDIDLSYNNFTFQSSRVKDCQIRDTNLFGFSSSNNTSVSCLGNYVCPRNLSSLYINCGGKGLSYENKAYEDDSYTGATSRFYQSGTWGFSNTGHFLDDGRHDTYIVTNTSALSANKPDLYINARSSPLSLTYYGFCMLNGSYNVNLHFAEILFTHDETYGSLGRRVFDIYIQGMLVEKDFNIVDEAGGVGKEIVKTYHTSVNTTLEIRLYWAGKGTTNIPFRGVYGPLISAISINPNFQVPQEDGRLSKNGKGMSVGIWIGIAIGAVCGIVLLLGVLWWWGCLRKRDYGYLHAHK